MAVLSDNELAEIRREFGPSLDENVALLVRPGERVKQGLGVTKPTITLVGPYGCRMVYISNQNVREHIAGGLLVSEGDYLVSLPAGILVYNSDIIRVSANAWLPNTRYVVASRVIPTNGDNIVMIAQSDGVSGDEEPEWPEQADELAVVNEGTVTWKNAGSGEEYQIIQRAGPTTYGDKISTRFICTLKQKGAPNKVA